MFAFGEKHESTLNVVVQRLISSLAVACAIDITQIKWKLQRSHNDTRSYHFLKWNKGADVLLYCHPFLQS